MSSLIANQAKTNVCLDSLKKLLIARTTFVPLNGYNNNYNYNCLSDMTICYSAYNCNCFVTTTRTLSQDCLN